MPNPAKLLANLVEEWTTAHGDVVTTVRYNALPTADDDERDPNVFDDGAFWRAQRRAVGYLEEIDEAIKGMEAMGEDVQHFRGQYPAWHKFVFATEVHWGASPSGGVTLDPSSLALLRALSQYLDATNYAPDVSLVDRVLLFHKVAEARDLVMTADFPPDVARYLLALLRESDDVVREYELYGAVRVRTMSLRLGGALLLASGNDAIAKDTTAVEKLRQVAGTIITGITIGVGVQAGMLGVERMFGIDPSIAIEAPVSRQIESTVAGVIEA